MPNPICNPATDIDFETATLHGAVDNVSTHTLSDNWTGSTVVGANGSPQTVTNSAFDGSNHPVSLFNSSGGGLLGTGVALGLSGGAPGTINAVTLDLHEVGVNIDVQIDAFGTLGNEIIQNISPPADSISGAGTLTGGGTGVTPTAANGTIVLHFNGPTQTISFDWQSQGGNTRSLVEDVTYTSTTPDNIVIVMGTTPGGPYTVVLPVGGILGDGTVGQPIDQTATALDPGTTYYYRTEVRDSDGHFIEASAECSFSTPPAISWCGGWHAPGDCILVDPGNSQPYENCNNGI